MENEFNKYELYTSFQSVYCYKDTNILKNKLGIRDYDKLREVETKLSFVRLENLVSKNITGRFTVHHLISIHKYLFGDIYSFAGHFRKEQIGKDNTWFYPPNEIKKQISKLFEEIREFIKLKDIEENFLLDRLSYFMAEINAIHPFREGNGRTIREFIRQLALFNGYEIDWSKYKKEDILKASILSFDNYTYLIEILKKCSKKI